jgi:PqqD family protein of HPr-rel-A system
MYPVSRSADLTVKRMGDELVVFDAQNGSVHHLNHVAGVVFQACDGRTDAAALARIVARIANVDEPGPAVELALEQLSRRGLLETTVERAAPERRRDRRDALKLLAKAAAIPIVLTLTASRARAAGESGDACIFRCVRLTEAGAGPLVPTEITVVGIYHATARTCLGQCPGNFFRTET